MWNSINWNDVSDMCLDTVIEFYYPQDMENSFAEDVGLSFIGIEYGSDFIKQLVTINKGKPHIPTHWRVFESPYE